ncbi:DivIVA domain-containing protein [Micromonospora viridifaciens]|uniref:DivIVA domain-containing protein n=1 Tax=Micromonospora viridifaciens TaxID=1881 RepID=A0A1C4V7R2_MICVI|nr:DivIVA domain-containing protein [Micromonospora viridifaciens]SCE79916.1 DivIVA domain-containing protein [Micromonospora viridifaciens]
MRAFFQGLRRNERPAAGPTTTAYRSSAYLPLSPSQVRQRRFRPTRVGRRGLDPDEVREFLDRVADDLAAAYRALGDSRQETVRIKDALRRWQSEQAQRANAGQYR